MYGVIDSGADITIIGGKLFKRVALAARLKKKDFMKPDKTQELMTRNRSHLMEGWI